MENPTYCISVSCSIFLSTPVLVRQGMRNMETEQFRDWNTRTDCRQLGVCLPAQHCHETSLAASAPNSQLLPEVYHRLQRGAQSPPQRSQLTRRIPREGPSERSPKVRQREQPAHSSGAGTASSAKVLGTLTSHSTSILCKWKSLAKVNVQ